MTLEQTHYVVMRSVGALVDGINPDTEADRINILRCILGVSAAELCKIIGTKGTQTELASLGAALSQVETLLKKGTLNA